MLSYTVLYFGTAYEWSCLTEEGSILPRFSFARWMKSFLGFTIMDDLNDPNDLNDLNNVNGERIERGKLRVNSGQETHERGGKAALPYSM
jgi:hypothetical protein